MNNNSGQINSRDINFNLAGVDLVINGGDINSSNNINVDAKDFTNSSNYSEPHCQDHFLQKIIGLFYLQNLLKNTS